MHAARKNGYNHKYQVYKGIRNFIMQFCGAKHERCPLWSHQKNGTIRL